MATLGKAVQQPNFSDELQWTAGAGSIKEGNA